jgi:hypothetical protein
VPKDELRIWQYFADKYQLSLTQFIVSAVDSYLHPEKPAFIARNAVPVQKWVTDGVGHAPQYVNLRLPRDTIAEWDEAGKQFYCTRMALVQQAINWVTKHQVSRKPVGLVGVACKDILLNLITTLGSLDFDHAQTIFQEWDRASIVQMLDALEEEGHIMRKGHETYMPVGGPDRTWGPRFVAGNLVHLTPALQTKLEEDEAVQHRLLVQAMFEYLEVYADKVDKMPAGNFEDLGRCVKSFLEKIGGRVQELTD